MKSPTLRDLLPVSGTLTPDEGLERFLGYVSAAGLTLYPAQEEAILELFGGSHVLLKTPTGSGKSLVAAAFQFQALSQGRRSVYTAPVKALVNEKFFALSRDLVGPGRLRSGRRLQVRPRGQAQARGQAEARGPNGRARGGAHAASCSRVSLRTKALSRLAVMNSRSVARVIATYSRRASSAVSSSL